MPDSQINYQHRHVNITCFHEVYYADISLIKQDRFWVCPVQYLKLDDNYINTSIITLIITRITIKPMNNTANGLKPLAFGFSVENSDIISCLLRLF